MLLNFKELVFFHDYHEAPTFQGQLKTINYLTFKISLNFLVPCCQFYKIAFRFEWCFARWLCSFHFIIKWFINKMFVFFYFELCINYYLKKNYGSYRFARFLTIDRCRLQIPYRATVSHIFTRFCLITSVDPPKIRPSIIGCLLNKVSNWFVVWFAWSHVSIVNYWE